MNINKSADLTELLQIGWESVRGGEQGCYYKILSENEHNSIELIINPKNDDKDFIINFLTETEEYHSQISTGACSFFDVLFHEIELLKFYRIII